MCIRYWCEKNLIKTSLNFPCDGHLVVDLPQIPVIHVWRWIGGIKLKLLNFCDYYTVLVPYTFVLWFGEEFAGLLNTHLLLARWNPF
jgi:hypothetical protein